MLTSSDSFSAGYEHIYDFANWIFGHGTGHSGVRMNILHWQENMTARYQDESMTRVPFFGSPMKCRNFVQTGIACWTCSIPEEATNACCSLDVVGGDGTHIGVSSKQTMRMSSVWKPEIPRDGILNWRRASRRPASFTLKHSDLGAVIAVLDPAAVEVGSVVSKACTHLVHILRDRPKIAELDDTTSECIKSIPEPIQIEFIRWFAGLPIDSSQFKPLQQILLSAVSSESVSGAYPAESIPHIQQMLTLSKNMDSESSEARRQTMLKYLNDSVSKFNRHVMLWHVWNLVERQVQCCDYDGRILQSTFDLIDFVGEQSILICMSIHVHFLIHMIILCNNQSQFSCTCNFRSYHSASFLYAITSCHYFSFVVIIS